MDLGATICTPKKPACSLCPLSDDCAARARGDQETFPRKAPKKTGALRRGAAFVVLRGEEILVRTRAEKGLLGGRTEVPNSTWLAGHEDADALAQAPSIKGVTRWHRKAGVVRMCSRISRLSLRFILRAFRRARARRRGCAGWRSRPCTTRRCRTSCAR